MQSPAETPDRRVVIAALGMTLGLLTVLALINVGLIGVLWMPYRARISVDA